MRTTTTHTAPPAHVQAIIDEVDTNGCQVLTDRGPATCYPRYAGMSHRTGALHSDLDRLTQHREAIVARNGFRLGELDLGMVRLDVALALAGEHETRPFVATDLYAHLRDTVAGVAPVPAGTGELNRSEAKAALFALFAHGTRVRIPATLEGLRLAAGVTALTWALPHLAAACDTPGFEERVHQEANRVTWELLTQIRQNIGGLARAVALGPDSVLLEIAPQHFAQAQALVAATPTGNVRAELAGPVLHGAELPA